MAKAVLIAWMIFMTGIVVWHHAQLTMSQQWDRFLDTRQDQSEAQILRLNGRVFPNA